MQKLLTIIAQIEVNIDYPEYDDAIQMSKEFIYPKTLELIEEMKVKKYDFIICKINVH